MIVRMPGGRPSLRPRTAFGERLSAARQKAGFSQAQLAHKVGVCQRSIAHWERDAAAVPTEQIEALARILDVSVQDLVCGNGQKLQHKVSPAGRMRQLFEEASKLPRRQQQKVADVLEPFIAQHTEKA